MKIEKITIDVTIKVFTDVEEKFVGSEDLQ